MERELFAFEMAWIAWYNTIKTIIHYMVEPDHIQYGLYLTMASKQSYISCSS